jgi:23S rRNA-/tRNA-specific pseudouridylate synthase
MIYYQRNKEIEMKLREWFLQRKVLKQYLAITKNVPKPNVGEINIPLLERSVKGINKVNIEL